jgi:hypothetical protein
MIHDHARPAAREAQWPVVTTYVGLPLFGTSDGSNGANPVTLGVGREGPQVGYYSGGCMPADRSEVELWLRMDPDALAAIPTVRHAVASPGEAIAADQRMLEHVMEAVAAEFGACSNHSARRIIAAVLAARDA